MSLKPLLRLALCLLLGFAGLPAHAVETPDAASLQAQLDELPGRALGESERALAKAALEQALNQLAARQQSLDKLAALKVQLTEAPRLTGQARRELTRLASTPVNAIASRYANADIAELEQQLAERGRQLSDWQQALTEASSLLITVQTRPERAQAEISSNQSRSLAINSQLKSARDGNQPLSEEKRSQLLAELAALDAQSELRREELAGNSQLQEWGNARYELLQARIQRLEQESLDLQALLSAKRQASSEQTVAELSREASQASPDSLVARETRRNLELSSYLLRVTERLNQLTRKNLQTRQQLDSVSQVDQVLDEQISVLKGSLLLSRILYEQQRALPRPMLDRRLADEIADIRLYQFELNQQREQLDNLDHYLDQLLAGQPASEADSPLRNTLRELATTRSGLIQQTNRELNALLNASITLQLNQKQLQALISRLNATLEEQMFWIPSNRPLDQNWLRQLPQQLQTQWSQIAWRELASELGEGLIGRPWLFTPLLLAIVALLARRRWLHDTLQRLHADIGHYQRDSQLHSPLALLLYVLLALPVSLFLGLCGVALLLDARGQNAVLGLALLNMAEAWLLFYSLQRVIAPGGMAERHFGWARQNLRQINRQLHLLGLVVMALVAVVTIAEQQPQALANDSIGLLVVLCGYLLMALILHRLMRAVSLGRAGQPLYRLLDLLVVLLPLAFVVAIGFGYYYTSLKLTDRLINTLYLVMLALMINALLSRGLSVAARRLAYARALAQRAAAPHGDSEEGSHESPVLDIEQVNQQSLRLIRLVLLGGFLLCLYGVWADLISVFTYLDQVSLYSYSDANGTAVPINLLDALIALLIALTTIVLARNLPGLLEVLVLSRLQLAQGSAYATTTLLTYAISAIGFVATLSVLGVSWDKLQWLVAALSVGIGFGMQEIFANFISGLIILFERPVRIGDVVTIGNLSGTVSKIRIRATTITDFDRKELIVPNKTFVTGQLVNWSLNDTVTRVIIRIGLAYESDLALARRLMLEAALDNERVLQEPGPSVYFLAISASTFDYELRFHVRELGDRNPATDEILTRIALDFREHGVDMAFNQLDVMVKNLENGQSLQVTSLPQPGSAPAPGDKPA